MNHRKEGCNNTFAAARSDPQSSGERDDGCPAALARVGTEPDERTDARLRETNRAGSAAAGTRQNDSIFSRRAARPMIQRGICLPHVLAAIDYYLLACYEACFVGQHHHHDIGNIFLSAEPLQRNTPFPRMALSWVVQPKSAFRFVS